MKSGLSPTNSQQKFSLLGTEETDFAEVRVLRTFTPCWSIWKWNKFLIVGHPVHTKMTRIVPAEFESDRI